LIFLGLLLRGVLRLLTRLAFVVLVVLTLAKVVSFALALWAEHHVDSVERLASRMFGMPVRVAHIETSWRGFTPRIWLHNLVIGDEEQLHLGDVLAAVSLRALPRWPENLPVALHLRGTRLQVERDEQGVTRIVGLPKPSGSFSPPALLLIENATVVWEDHKRGARLVERNLDLQVLSRGNLRELLVTSRNRDLRIRGELRGRLTGTDWSARFWVQGKRLDIAQALAPYLPEKIRLHSAKVDLEAWSRWDHGSHRGSRLRFRLPETMAEREGAPPLTLHELSGDLAYQVTDTGWTLQLAGATLKAAEAPPLEGLAVAVQANGNDLLLGFSSVELASLTPLTRLLPLEPDHLESIAAIAPGGRLENLRLHFRQREENPAWNARASLRDLHATAWKKLPGIQGLQAELFAGPSRVRLLLESEDTLIDLPHLFRQPIELGLLEGELVWKKTAAGWSLDSHALVAENQDLATITRLHLSKTDGEPLFADIQTDFRNGDGAQAPRYYPVGIMKEKLVKWLDEAILFGRISEGSFILHGPLSSFPFHETHDGHFEVLFQAEDLALAYHEQWPPLQEADGSVRFHNNSLEIELGSTRIYNSEILHAVARIPSLKPLAPLEVSGVVEGPLADELRLLRETPLKAKLARHVEGIELQGNGRLKARLRIPFKSHDYRFDGTLDFQNARFLWVPQKLAIDRLEGRLEIDNHGIRGKEITGRAFGARIQLQVAPLADSTRISAQGRIPATALVKQYPLLKAARPTGSAEARVQLDLPNYGKDSAGAIVLDIRSKLEGMALELPPPLAKEAEASRELALGLRITEKEKKLTLRLDDDLGLTALVGPDDRLGLSVALSRLPLRSWIRWFSRMPETGPEGAPKIGSIRLQVKRLEAYPLLADDLLLELEKSGNGWQGTMKSDAITGELRLESGKGRQKLELDLEVLRLATASPVTTSTPSSRIDTLPDPRSMALLELRARKFYFNQADLGELHVRSSEGPRGQIIETLELTGGIARIEARGEWVEEPDGQFTHMKGTLNTDDMGRFLREAMRMDFLAGSKAYFSFDITWPGAPFQFDLARLAGRLQLDMTAGRFLNIKPGAARILGLLNVRSLERRLKFGFKDLYEEGLAFDTIMGSFQLEDGLIYTNDLEVSAPSSLIRIAGSTSLADRTHDQLVTVSPRLDATLPVAGAVAGGPVAGLVVLLAQQAFSSKLEKIQRMRYSVTGSWDDPRVEPLGRKKTPPPEEEAGILEP